jgi:hypothetical protein
MTQSKRPPVPLESREPDPGPRDRVRERMRQMAKLALLAATPLTNAACDPIARPDTAPCGAGLPAPTCQKSPSTWAKLVRVATAWDTDAGERILLLMISTPTDKPWLRTPSSYTVEGGTLLPPTAVEPDVIRIKPDAGATAIRLRGTMTCHTVGAPMVISIDLLPGGGSVLIDLG